MKPIRFVYRNTVRLAKILVVLVVIGLLAGAVISRSKKDLEKWHTAVPMDEFHRSLSVDFTFKDYLKLEERLAASLKKYEIIKGTSGYSYILRYITGGANNPDSLPQNWNWSYELVPDQIRGGALLLHGLTDSPYSVRTLGELLRDKGYYVLCLRLPGHGTVPAGQIQAHRPPQGQDLSLVSTVTSYFQSSCFQKLRPEPKD